MATDATVASLCDQAREYLKQLKTEEGENAARRAVELDPRSDDAHTLLGIALCRRGQTAEGIEALGHAVVINPANVTARSNLATARHQAGHLEAARAEWQAVLGLDANNTKARGALAVVEWQMQHSGTGVPVASQPPAQPAGPAAFDLPGFGPMQAAQPAAPQAPIPQAVRYDLAGNPIPVTDQPVQAAGVQGGPVSQLPSPRPTYYEPTPQPRHGTGPAGGGTYNRQTAGAGDDPGGWSLDNVMAILTSPSAVMASQRGHHGIAKPLLFSVINSALVGTAVLITVMVRFATMANSSGGQNAGIAMTAGLIGALVGFVVGLAFGVAIQFASAGLVHLFVMMFGGRQPYGATYRALIYAGVPTSLGYTVSDRHHGDFADARDSRRHRRAGRGHLVRRRCGHRPC
ncbi:MAG: hypothetical protein FJX72_10115 [Armatimonadetes bacterium]|nr:hypothetical protein [Armatimonadota bacterium]